MQNKSPKSKGNKRLVNNLMSLGGTATKPVNDGRNGLDRKINGSWVKLQSRICTDMMNNE